MPIMKSNGRRSVLSGVPVVTAALVLINVAVFLYVEVNGSSYDTDFMLQMGASYEPYIVEEHQYYRLITHFFLHFGFEHLFNNMISLAVMGYAVERSLGHVRFGILYFFSGLLAGIASLVYNVYTGSLSVSCGASGAIFGLSGALLVLVIRGNRGRRWSTEVPRYVLFLLLSLYSGYLDESIDHIAHFGGFIAGIILCFLLTLRKKNTGITYQ